MRRIVKIVKISFFCFLGILGLLILLLAFTQTGMFKDWLRDQVVSRSGDFINGSVDISQIDGNFITNLQISGVTVTADENRILSINNLKLQYSPLKFFKGEIAVDSVYIDSLYIQLVQAADSSWNVANLIPVDSSAVPDTADSESSFPFLITVGGLQLSDSRLEIAALDSIIPRQVNDLNIRLSGAYSDDVQKLNLNEFRFNTKTPDLTLSELTLAFSKEQNIYLLNDFNLKTGLNQFDAAAEFYANDQQLSQGRFNSEPIQFQEFQFALPPLQIAGEPVLTITTDYQNDVMNLNIDISEGEQQIVIAAKLQQVRAFFEDDQSRQLKYGVRGQIKNIDVAHWLADPELAYLINGEFQIDGRGITAEDAVLTLDANFPNCQFFEKPIEMIEIDGTYNRGNATADIGFAGDFGSAEFQTKITDVAKSQAFEVQGNATNFNLARLVENDSLQTDVTVSFQAAGSQFDPELMNATVTAEMTSSSLLEYSFDSLLIDLKITGMTYAIDTLQIETPYVSIGAGGTAAVAGDNDLTFTASVKDLMSLQHIIPADTMGAAGKFEGRIHGKIDSLFVAADLDIQTAFFNDIEVDTISGQLSLFAGEGFDGEGELSILNAAIAGIEPADAQIDLELQGQTVDVSLNLSNPDSIFTDIKTRIVLDSIPEIVIPEMLLSYKEYAMSGGSDDMKVILEENAFIIENFELSAGNSDVPGDRLIRADGIISLEEAEDFTVTISGILLENVMKLFDLPAEIGGEFNLNVKVEGTAENPLIRGRVSVNEGRINEFTYNRFGGAFDYTDEIFSWNLGLVPNEADSLSMKGFLPMNLSLKNSGETLKMDDPFEIKLKTTGLPFALFLSSMDGIQRPAGTILTDVKIGNTLADPRANGFIRVRAGAFSIPQYGLKYHDFQMEASAVGNRVTLDAFQARRDKGFIRASGYLEFDSSLVSGVIKTTQFNLKADKIFLARHKDYEIQVSADASLYGDTKAPKFNGKLEVLRSSFFLPALLDEYQNNTGLEDLSKPLLVEALEASRNGGDSLGSGPAPIFKKTKEEMPAFYRNLQGSMKLRIPRNTWIKSPDMRLEIDGDLDLVKNGPDFEIFGTIKVVRGNYDVLGRRFNIKEEGRLTFIGGREINPLLNLQAEYSFRDVERNQRALTLQITDSLITPKLLFQLDGTKITEGDAISYMMFGRSLDELTYGEKSNVSGSPGTGALAIDVAANYLSGELTKKLGKDLNLDYLEIKGQDNWQTATFAIGKYLTNDIFVSYERGFGKVDEDQTSPETITLEYQVTRLLFLQLFQGTAQTSGFEVILKLEK